MLTDIRALADHFLIALPNINRRYDGDVDRMVPEPPGPRVFSRAIRSTPLPSLFRPPTSIAKYNGETKP